MHGGAILALGVAALLSAAGMARGQSVEYEFDTGSGQVTRNGQQVFDFEGVPFVGLGASGGGVYTWAVLGDMTVSGVVEVKFTGPNLASVLVGRDLRVFAGGVIRADADGVDGGPGGGSGGAGGSGGDGGTGGTGGGGANGEDGLRGQDAAGQSAGAGGLLYQEGGDGGNGTTTGGGQAGGSGLARIAGENGEIGVGGSSGSPGSPGVNNPVFPSQGGTPGGPGLGGLGGVQPGGGGFGGQAGAPGLGGGDGTDGSPGFEAGDGGDGSSPAPYLPAPDAVLVLNGGSGGSGGGAGGGGGGGGAGSSGAGGGGGGGGRGGITVVGDDIIISGGGGGGGGGGAGSGGRGGEGGTGGEGASGGGGGGGVRFLVQGRVDIDGLISARGADFSGQNDGAPGSDGEDGGQGGPGGQGAPGFGPLGQHGGPGGPGGAGGRGGPGGTGGDGGRGGGGSGGAVFLAGTALGGLGSVDLGGGLGAISIAPSGRVVLSEATVDSFDFVYPVTPAATTRTTLLSPVAESPYFGGLVTPNIVPSGAGLANLDGGPGPFGVLPLGFNDPQILGAAGGAPAGAVAAVIRYDAGPSPYDLAYNLDSATATADAFDVFVVVNLSAGPIRPDINGEPVTRLPYTRRIEFGGGGLPEAVDIGFGRSWAMLGPETGDVSLVVRLGQAETTLILADPAAGDAETVYFVPACVADLAEPFGVLNFFDLTAFVGLYNAGDPAADLAAPFGVWNFFDVTAFLDLYNAGCP